MSMTFYRCIDYILIYTYTVYIPSTCEFKQTTNEPDSDSETKSDICVRNKPTASASTTSKLQPQRMFRKCGFCFLKPFARHRMKGVDGQSAALCSLRRFGLSPYLYIFVG